MANGIDIVIGAEVSGALQGLQKVEAATVKAGATINKLPAAVNSATQAISKIKPGSNEASQSLINLSRVAQDAPYGFLGIANNINPLLESFQRLKTSTGTTGGALKALAGSISGAGGLGLAVGVVSSLLVVFGDKLFGAGQKAKEAKEQQNGYNESVKSAISAVADEAAKVSGLVRFINLETTSRKERVNAIKELQSIAPSYFATLDAEKASIGQVTSAYNIYLLSLRRAVEAKVTEKQLSDVIERRLELEKKLYKPLTEQIMLNGKLVTVRNAVYDADGTVKKQQEELVQLKKDELTLANKLGLLTPPKVTPENSKPVKIKADKIEVKPKSVIIDFNQGVSDKQIADLTKYMFDKSVKFDFIAPELIPPEEAKQQGLTFSQMFGHEVEKYFKQTDPIDFGLMKAVREFKPPKTFSFKMFEGLSEEQFKLAESAELITNTLAPAFDNLINAIGRGENAFQAFGEGVKQVLVQVISKLVQTALLAAALSLIPGGVGGVKGFGAIFSSLLGFGGARAGGGPVSFGKSYLVGENGPELFVPSNSGRIMNGNQIAAMSYSGGGSSGGGRQIIRGQNIILAYARTNRAQNRLGRG